MSVATGGTGVREEMVIVIKTSQGRVVNTCVAKKKLSITYQNRIMKMIEEGERTCEIQKLLVVLGEGR